MESRGNSHVYSLEHSHLHDSQRDFSAEGSLENLGTDTDSGLSGSILGDNSKLGKRSNSGELSETSSPSGSYPKGQNERRLNNFGEKKPPVSPDGGVVLEASGSSSPDVWNDEEVVPLQFKIEEHIEEVTTYQVSDNEDVQSDASDVSEGFEPRRRGSFSASNSHLNELRKGSYKRYSSTSSLSDRALPCFDLNVLEGYDENKVDRVPFPELGMDLLQESSSLEDGGPSEMVLENTDWTENWRFRKGLSNKYQPVKVFEAIDMLIPNPSSIVAPTVGDRDIDELSELSEQFSNCSGEFSSEEEVNTFELFNFLLSSSNKTSDLHDVNPDFCQKDLEYTEDVSVIDRKHITKLKPEAESSRSQFLERNSSQSYVYSNSINAKRFCSRPKDVFDHSKRPAIDIYPPCVLTPPQNVPGVVDATSTSSNSIWFENFPQTQLVPAGRALRLSCQVRGKKFFGVSWYFDGKRLDDADDVVIWRQNSVHNFAFFGFEEEKAGTYYVAAYTKDDCVWASCNVLCADQLRQAKLPVFHIGLNDVKAQRGSQVILECQVSGHPEPMVKFYVGESEVNSSGTQVSVENDPYGTWMLHLYDMEERHAGAIRAVASNSVGESVTFCQLDLVDGVSMPKSTQKHVKIHSASNVKNLPEKEKSVLLKSEGRSGMKYKTRLDQKERKNNNCLEDANYLESKQVLIDCFENNFIDSGSHLFQPPVPGISNGCASHPNSLFKSYSLPSLIPDCFPLVANVHESFQSRSLPSLHLKTVTDSCISLKKDSKENASSVLPQSNNFNINPKGDVTKGTTNINSGDLHDSSSYKTFPHSHLSIISEDGGQGSSSSSVNLEQGSQGTHSGLEDNFFDLPGSIAEREHRKWLEAKPLLNNPYSPEKLVHRLDKSSSGSFPSLPMSVRDCVSSEYLGDVEPPKVDLSRYSRDYHVHKNLRNREKSKVVDNCQSPFFRTNTSLVKLDVVNSSSDWKDELKDMRLNVGKRVADLQKTINQWQQNWGKKLHKGSSSKNKYKFKPSNNLSSSCMNLSSPAPVKSNFGASSGNYAGNRHLVYSSTEALNSGKDNPNIWRTVSENTLNTPVVIQKVPKTLNSRNKYPHSNNEKGFHGRQTRRFSGHLNSDSDDSSVANAQYNGDYSVPKSRNYSGHRRNVCYYSENSVESLRESDTEESVSIVDSLPSVKELAQKFSSMEFLANETKEKNYQSASTPSAKTRPLQRHASDASPNKQVHHSLTARHISRSFREGLRKHSNAPTPVIQTTQNDGHWVSAKAGKPTKARESQALPRDASSPEHLGIPINPAFIPQRCHYYNPQGDTSDDSLSGFPLRKVYRKKMPNGTGSKPVLNGKDFSMRDQYVV